MIKGVIPVRTLRVPMEITASTEATFTQAPGVRRGPHLPAARGRAGCWKLDRLGRSLVEMMRTIDSLRQKEVHFQSLTEQFDSAKVSRL